MGSSTENSAYGPTRNPWDRERVPGGSSGGSAAAVAAAMAPLSLGTDTGGSIRQPAALCGVVGMKPTYGAVSRYGAVAFASSLDQVGPFARTVRDCALALRVIAGPDTCDSTCLGPPEPIELPEREDLRGLRVGAISLDGIARRRARRARELRGGARDRAGARRRARRGQPRVLADAACAGGLLPDRAGRGLREPGPLRRRSLWPARARRRRLRDVRRDAPARLRARGQAPLPDRRLRALGGLLRRLLRPGAARAHAHPARLRAGLRELRPAAHPDLADGRVPHRRAGRRPARDVRLRPLHAARSTSPACRRSRCPAGFPRACRSDCTWPARPSARTGCWRPRTRSRGRFAFDPTPPALLGAHERARGLGGRDRPRDPRAALDAQQDVLPLPERVRAASRTRASARSARRSPARSRSPTAPRSSARSRSAWRWSPRSRRIRRSTARTTSIPTRPRRTRSASSTNRSAAAAGWPFRPPTATTWWASSGCTWRRTPPRRCTRAVAAGAWPARMAPWSTSTAAARR